eukprot:2392558-Prymnesium_polylepis.1
MAEYCEQLKQLSACEIACARNRFVLSEIALCSGKSLCAQVRSANAGSVEKPSIVVGTLSINRLCFKKKCDEYQLCFAAFVALLIRKSFLRRRESPSEMWPARFRPYSLQPS